jgi:hypothetical protein
MPLELEDVIVSEPGVEDDQDHEFSEIVASNQTLPASRSSNVLNRNISNQNRNISNQNRNNDDDLDTSFNTQLNINRDAPNNINRDAPNNEIVAPNNEIVAPNRHRSVSPLADLESNRSSTVVSNRSSTTNSTPNSTLHFTRPPAQSNVRLARFTSINNTPRNSANNSANKFSFNVTNLARISHSLEILDRKIENLANRREPAAQAATTLSRDDMIVYSARFRQLLANEFGYNEIYDHPLEYFVSNSNSYFFFNFYFFLYKKLN